MPKLDYLQQKKLNPADELRETLGRLEVGLSRIKSMDPAESLEMLHDFDRANTLFQELETTELDLAPEQGRFDSLQNGFKKHAVQFLKRLGGPTALSEHRPTPSPDRERWWWYIHEIVATYKRRLVRRMMVTLIVILLVGGGLVLAFNTILAPSPEAVARAEAESASLLAFDNGDYAEALASVEQGLAQVPGSPTLLILKGIFLEALQEEEKAAQSFEQARTNLGESTAFHVGRGQLYLRTRHFDKAEEDARAALALDESLPVAWLLLGQALEFQGRQFEAIPVYQHAGELALASGNNEVAVLARLALGRVGIKPGDVPEPAP
jgi:tetratricopeptide (TPR) repeat protein